MHFLESALYISYIFIYSFIISFYKNTIFTMLVKFVILT